MRNVSWVLAVVLLASCASEPGGIDKEEPTEWGTARHLLFGFALANGVPRDKAVCVVDEIMRTTDPAEMERLEAIAQGDQKLTENEMRAFHRIYSIRTNTDQPSVAAACGL